MNTVSILAEVPEELHESLKRYLENHPGWDQHRVFTAALALFLQTNGGIEDLETKRQVARTYLSAIFQPLVAHTENGGTQC